MSFDDISFNTSLDISTLLPVLDDTMATEQEVKEKEKLVIYFNSITVYIFYNIFFSVMQCNNLSGSCDTIHFLVVVAVGVLLVPSYSCMHVWWLVYHLKLQN